MSTDILLTVEIGGKKYGTIISQEWILSSHAEKVAEKLGRMVTNTILHALKGDICLEEIND